jgi:DNA repair photolyase
MADQLFELRRRTFDTPHFRGITFIETEAKTILNKVPGNYLPFNWTINPYRGCTHSCTYCMSGDTPILMADGRLKPLAELAVGDHIYGTAVQGNYRRYVRTAVQAHWSTLKRAYRITLGDGTELIASGDHRFLSDRGWKHVVGAEHGPDRRPFLTTNNKLMGFGRMARRPKDSSDYRLGYLCGMVRGDGHVGTYSYAPRPGRTVDEVHRFRLALVDFEALKRTKAYLADLEVETQEFVFAVATATHSEARAIRTSRRASVERVRTLIDWPTSPTLDWCKGFLAGIFDAEGSCGRNVLRISTSDEEIIGHTVDSLRRLGFFYVREDARTPANKPVSCIRLIGGLSERLRFFHTVGPAISRKMDIEGFAIKNDANLKVESVEDLGIEMPMFDITTGTGDFIANGVVSHNCFARATHTFLDMDAGRDFETKIVVKVNAPDLLRRELRKKRWSGESIAMGTNTDPYQRCEGKYKLMPRIIEVLTEYRNPFSILTKGTLIMRDIEALAQAAELTDVSTAFSIATLDEDAWRRSEPGTPHPRKRLEAVKRLNEAGVACGVLVAPILPGITDRPDQLREVVEAAIEAGATHVSPILLHLRPKVKEVYLEWLRDEYPDLVPRYQEMYARSAYASTHDKDELSKSVRDLIASYGGIRATRRRKTRESWRSELERQKAKLSTEQMKLL